MRKYLIWFGVVLASLLVWLAMRNRGPAATGSLRPHSETRAVERGDGPAPLDSPAEIGTGSARDLAAESETSPTFAAAALTKLDPTVVVELRIVDVDGGPIPGAGVETWGPSPRAIATADDQGIARLILPSLPERGVHLEVSADGFFHYRQQRNVTRHPKIVLRHRARISGVVVDAETGAAISGAVVRVPHGECGECPPAEDVTDASGRFALDPVPGSARVGWLATAEGNVGATARLLVPRDATDTRLDIALATGLRLAGRVVDLATSLPVADAVVRHGIDSATSDANGEFALPVDGVVSSQVVVEHPGYAGLSASIDRLDLDVRRVELTLVPLVPITGGVRDATGRPIAGATTRVGRVWGIRDIQDTKPLSGLPTAWRVHDAHALSTTDADGRFRVVGAVAWRSGQELRVTANGYREVQLALPSCPLPGEERVDVVLEPVAHAVITGTLTVNGLPATGYVDWEAGDDSVGARALNGSFRLERVEPGPGELYAYTDDFEEFDLPGAKVSLDIEPSAAVHYDFALEIPMLPISGHVRFPDGRPAAGETVTAAKIGPTFHDNVTADENGAYAISVPAVPEPYMISVGRGGISYRRRDVAAGASGVDIDLGAEGTLRLRTLDARSREPIVDASYEITPLFTNDLGSMSQTAPYASGWREVELAAGSWRVVAHAGERGFSGLWQTARIVSGETSELEFPLQRGVRVALVAGPGCDPPMARAWLVEQSIVEDAKQQLLDPDSPRTPSETLVSGVTIFRNLTIYDDDPQVLDGVPPGHYQLLSAPGFLSPYVDLVFEPDVIVVPDDAETVRFDVVWRKASAR